MSKALFLDRDGTLIVDIPYLADPSKVQPLPGVGLALQRAKDIGYKLFLFTNQSGIGRGRYTLEQAIAVNTRMTELLNLPTPVFEDVCIAPERPDQPSAYRKPSPKFILESIQKFQLDPKSCYMIGDRSSDVEAGLNAEVNAIAVCTGEYNESMWRTKGYGKIPIFPSVTEFIATL